MTTAKILQDIAAFQCIQKRNPPSSVVWQGASKQLKTLFAEMASRSTRETS